MAKMAAMKAYKEAGNHGCIELIYTITMVTGIQAADAQVIEVHDCFSTNELLTYEALVSGLCIGVNFQGRKCELFMLPKLLG